MSRTTNNYLDHLEAEQAKELEIKNTKTLTQFIYRVIKDKELAHDIDQVVRNALTPYLLNKPETIRALYGEGKE